MSPRKLPAQVYNVISLSGVDIALFALAAILILYLLNVFAAGSNPYLGILIFLVFPGVLVVGLLLIPLGMWREKRRLERGRTQPLLIDLGNPRHRNAAIIFGAGTSIFLLLSTLGLYEGYQYTESVTFCGKVCHQVMKPEHTAYLNSPHARVECVNCHIGPGAGWYVKSKLSGARQVVKTVLNTYPRPIPTPIENLRPAQEVCEQCHWPAKFYPANEVVSDHFLPDEQNRHWQIRMLMKVGGTSASPSGEASGIHWHIDAENEMTYIAADSSRQSFQQLTWRQGGALVTYTSGGKPLPDSVVAAAKTEGLERRLDCIDCHNRPSHKFQSPMAAVNEALAAGTLDPGLPWIKREAVTALSKRYETEGAAMDSIAASLHRYYAEKNVSLPATTAGAVQVIFRQNMFPQMKARWDVYPDNRGHFIYKGCFRCHGSDLETADGQTIPRNCDLCHVIVAQGFVGTLADTLISSGVRFQHPVDIGEAWTEMACYECHEGGDELY
jgi:hypothetical protein